MCGLVLYVGHFYCNFYMLNKLLFDGDIWLLGGIPLHKPFIAACFLDLVPGTYHLFRDHKLLDYHYFGEPIYCKLVYKV